MIQNFVYVLNNGLKTKVGEYLPSVPLLQQINDPEYRPKAYQWENDGRTFTRQIDGHDTRTAHLLPDGDRIIVLQAQAHYGADNVRSEERRVGKEAKSRRT